MKFADLTAACAAVTVLGLSSAAQAQGPAAAPTSVTQIQLYGTIDVAVGQVETQPPGAPNAAITRERGVIAGGLQTSYIGFRGNEDLGGGLTARFQIESFFRADTGKTGRFDASPTTGADNFWSRDTFVSLAGGFGEVRLGANATPLWIAMIQTNALGANSVFSPSFRQLFNGGSRGRSEVDTYMVNSVRYLTPVLFDGLSGTIAVQAGEGSGTGANYSAQVGYRAGAIVLSAAVQKLRHAANPNLPGARDQDMVLIGGSYNFGPIKLFGQYTDIDNDRLGSKDKLTHLGFTAPIGGGELQFSRGVDKSSGATANSTAKRTTTSGGYVYSMSKRTDLYAFLMSEKMTVGTGESYAVGVRHRF